MDETGPWATPVSREGVHVNLKPLSEDHASELAEAAADGLSTLWYTRVPSPASTLRHHFDVFAVVRDTCVYRIIASEWPQGKAHLEWRMNRYPVPHAPWMALR